MSDDDAPVAAGEAAEPAPPGRRHVVLPDGRTLDMRPAEPGDVEGLRALFASLDLAARERRFFSAYRPDDRFLRRLAEVPESEGVQLVAEVTPAGEPPARGPELVAEAGYRLLPDGDGELAITVADGWRGWLGPYLLDALLEAAARRGVTGLEADVRITNAPMLALVRARGYAAMAHDEPAVVRVLVPTEGTVPSWPPGEEGADAPRVLVEAPGGAWHGAERLRRAGLRVLACAGPGSRSRPCPALEGRPCPLVADADAVVLAHAPDDEPWVALPGAHGRLHPGVPVCVEVEGGEPGVVELVERTARDHAATVNRAARPSDRGTPEGGPAAPG